MEPIRYIELIIEYEDEQLSYEHIDIDFIKEVSFKNVGGIFVIYDTSENNYDDYGIFKLGINLDKVPDDMKLYLKKINGKIVDLQGLLSKVDIVLEQDNKLTFYLNDTSVVYDRSRCALIFEHYFHF